MKKSLSKKAKKAIRANSALGPDRLAKDLELDSAEVRRYMENAGLMPALAEKSTPAEKFLRIVDGNAFRIVVALAVLYAVYLSYVSLRKYFTFACDDFDLPVFVQFMHNTIHGSFGRTTISADTILHFHQFFTMFLLAPFYAILPYPWLLLVVQSLALGAAVIPLYKLAERVLSRNWGVAFALAYVLYPAKTYMNLFEFHPMSTAVPILLALFYFWYVKKWWWFVGFMAAALLTREDVSLVVFMFAFAGYVRARMEKNPAFKKGNFWKITSKIRLYVPFLCLFRSKNTLKWVIVPGLVGFVYFILAVKIIAPMFGSGDYAYFGLYRDWGASMGEVAKNVATHPFKAIGYMLSSQKAEYLLALILPVAFLCFISPVTLLLALPIFMENLLTSKWSTSQIYFQYVSYPTAVIFAASVLGLKRLLSWNETPAFRKLVFAGFGAAALISALIYGPVLWPGAMLSGSDKPMHMQAGIGSRADVYRGFIKKVPPDANLTATFRFLHHTSQRAEIESFHYAWMAKNNISDRPYELPAHTNWALVDMQELKTFRNFSSPDWGWNMSNTFGLHRPDGKWGVVDYMDDVVLLEKGHKGGPSMFEINPPERPSKRLGYNFANNQAVAGFKLNLAGVTLEVAKPENGFRHLGCSLFCTTVATQQTRPPYVLVRTRIVDRTGRAVVSGNFRALGTYFYSTIFWRPGATVVDRMRIYLPPDMGPGKYRVQASVFCRFVSGGRPAIAPLEPAGVMQEKLTYTVEGVYVDVGSFELE